MKWTVAKYVFILAMSCGSLMLPQTTTSLAREQVPPLDKFLKDTAGLTDIEIADIHHGNALAKVLDPSMPTSDKLRFGERLESRQVVASAVSRLRRVSFLTTKIMGTAIPLLREGEYATLRKCCEASSEERTG